MNKEAYTRNFGKLYKTCIKVLDLKKSAFTNLFDYASNYTQESLREILGTGKDYVEIKPYNTKNHCPVVVELENMD